MVSRYTSPPRSVTVRQSTPSQASTLALQDPASFHGFNQKAPGKGRDVADSVRLGTHDLQCCPVRDTVIAGILPGSVLLCETLSHQVRSTPCSGPRPVCTAFSDNGPHTQILWTLPINAGRGNAGAFCSLGGYASSARIAYKTARSGLAESLRLEAKRRRRAAHRSGYARPHQQRGDVGVANRKRRLIATRTVANLIEAPVQPDCEASAPPTGRANHERLHHPSTESSTDH